MSLITKMENNELFTQSELSIRNFVLKEKENIAYMNTDEIARDNFVSKSTLTRFAKKLGFSGWNDFRLQFVKELAYSASIVEEIDANYPFFEQNNIVDITNNLFALKKNTLNHFFSSIDLQNVGQAVQLLNSQKRIHIFAEGYSLLASDDFCFRMTRIGKLVTNQNEVGLYYNALSLTNADLAIIVSYTGRTLNVINAFRYLYKQGIPTLVITSNSESPMKNNATVSILIPEDEDIYSKIGNYATVDSIRTIFDLLYSCYVAENPMLVIKRIQAARQLDKKINI